MRSRDFRTDGGDGAPGTNLDLGMSEAVQQVRATTEGQTANVTLNIPAMFRWYMPAGLRAIAGPNSIDELEGASREAGVAASELLRQFTAGEGSGGSRNARVYAAPEKDGGLVLAMFRVGGAESCDARFGIEEASNEYSNEKRLEPGNTKQSGRGGDDRKTAAGRPSSEVGVGFDASGSVAVSAPSIEVYRIEPGGGYAGFTARADLGHAGARALAGIKAGEDSATIGAEVELVVEAARFEIHFVRYTGPIPEWNGLGVKTDANVEADLGGAGIEGDGGFSRDKKRTHFGAHDKIFWGVGAGWGIDVFIMPPPSQEVREPLSPTEKAAPTPLFVSDPAQPAEPAVGRANVRRKPDLYLPAPGRSDLPPLQEGGGCAPGEPPSPLVATQPTPPESPSPERGQGGV
ncbi:MAG TPA: hypothetical protein VN345_06970, partial [Blastocatellia bacterium]|nr:hypothetical protein [Blastocatellia bacterium]